MTRFELHAGDALSLMKDFETGSINFVFSDPPYFLSNGGFTVKSGKQVSVNKGNWDRSRGFETDVAFHRAWIGESLRLLDSDGTLAISGTYHSIYQCGYLLQEFGCRIINDIIWFKPNGAPALAGRNLTASHETILWASKNPSAKHTFNYEMSRSWDLSGDTLKRPGKQMRSVWSIPSTPKREKLAGPHPTQKPLELLLRLIAFCTRPGDKVLDPFCGSGTTGVAALSQGRDFVGIDISPEFLEISRKRMENLGEENIGPPKA